jgi:hypothetical protein
MQKNQKDLSLSDCAQIIKKCRRQITQSNGMIEACRLLEIGESLSEVKAQALEHNRKYTARMNEVIQIQNELNELLNNEDIL